MKKMAWLVVMMLGMLSVLAGCGSDPAVQPMASQLPSKSVFTIIDTKTQEFQFAVDARGDIKDLRVGGIEIKPADIDSVVYVSYRFGDATHSPFRATIDPLSLKATFVGLPNNEDGGEYWITTKTGHKWLVELDLFEKVWKSGVYAYVDSNSNIQWGEIEAESSQDGIEAFLDEGTKTMSIKGSFGCDLMFGLKQPVVFQDGLQVVFEESTGAMHSGPITQDALGNIIFSLSGIPVTKGPYGEYNNTYPTKGTLYVLLPNGIKVPFNFGYNTTEWRNDSTYIWGIYGNGGESAFYIDSYNTGDYMIINWYPPYSSEY